MIIKKSLISIFCHKAACDFHNASLKNFGFASAKQTRLQVKTWRSGKKSLTLDAEGMRHKFQVVSYKYIMLPLRRK
ncbi:MAG: hypothetical protein QM445_12630 [Thermotogota bacterium]|nr:hypothetical protein [Thermotogota bacterium]